MKTGLYIDLSNVYLNGGSGVRYEILRDFARRRGAESLRLNAYLCYDRDRARRDDVFREGQERFQFVLRNLGYKVIVKDVKHYTDEEGNTVSKANMDLDIAVDALSQSDRLDKIVLVTGDGDFVPLVRALQGKGCRVECVAFKNVSRDLVNECDFYMCGYLIPNLVPPMDNTKNQWGEKYHYARGVCVHFDHVKNCGRFRFVKTIDGDFLDADVFSPDSPYESLFFHISDFTTHVDTEIFNDRDYVFEFKIDDSINERFDVQATDISFKRVVV